MEGQGGHLTGASQAEWFFMKAKVALAVAIIKNKPSGSSGRECAEALACKLKSQDESWKKKAEELQQEVLRLRQELLITRVTSTRSATEAADHGNTMDVSQDLFGPGSVACSADLQPDCDSETSELLLQDLQPAISSHADLQPGCDSETPELLVQDLQPAISSHADLQPGCDSETPGLLVQDLQPAISSHADLQPGCDSETPELLLQDLHPAISSPEPVPSSHHRNPPGNTMLPHVQFLQSLCALHRVEDHRGLESLWLSPDGDAGSVLADSACQLLDSVVAACRDPPPLGPRDLVLQACQVAAGAVDLFCSQRLPSAEFMRRVEESLRELTGMLLHSNQLSGLRAAEKLTEYLITLGSSSMSKSLLIRHILSQISALADQLWQAFQGQESSRLDRFPVDQYQNSCRLFWILEELLQKSKVPCRVEVGSEQRGFLSHLEQRAFLLSNEFPLFSICMWRIGGLLTSSDT